jgi:hypothetical protein
VRPDHRQQHLLSGRRNDDHHHNDRKRAPNSREWTGHHQQWITDHDNGSTDDCDQLGHDGLKRDQADDR